VTDTEPMARDNDLILAQLEQIARWERSADAPSLLTCAIVQGGVLEREACAALQRLGEKGSAACQQGVGDPAAPPFHRFSAARILGVTSQQPAAGRTLIELLGNPDLALRRGATEGLAYRQDSQAADALVALLTEEDAPLKRGACFALQQLGDKRVTPALLPLLHHRNPNVRRAAIRAIAALDGPSHASELLETLHDRDRSVRRALVQALAQLHLPEVADALLHLSRDEAIDIRHEAIGSLGRFLDLDPRMTERLIEALDDRSNHVRRAAVQVIATHRVTRAVRALCDLVRDAPERLSRIAAARALGVIGDPYAVDRLSQALLVEDFDLQDAAQEALGAILGEVDLDALRAEANLALERWSKLTQLGGAAVPALVRAAQSPDHTAQGTRVRAAAAQALGVIGRLGHPGVVVPLLELLDEKIPAVKVAAAQALATVGDRTAAARLVELLEDRNPNLREAGVKALGTLGEEAAIPRVLRIAQDDPEPALQLAAVGALAGMGAAALPALIELLAGDRPTAIRKEACYSLAALGTPLAVDGLMVGLVDADSAVRGIARQGLKRYAWHPIGERTRRVDEGYARWTFRREWTASPEPVDQVELLGQALDDPAALRRRLAAEALGDMGDRRSVPPLTAKLGDPDVDVAIVAAEALVALGEQPGPGPEWLPYRAARLEEPAIVEAGARAFPALLSELASPSPDIRERVVALLAHTDHPDRIAALFVALHDLYPEVVEAASQLLTRLGRDAIHDDFAKFADAEEQRAQLAQLAPLLVDERPGVRTLAAMALSGIRHDDALPFCYAGLDDATPAVVLESIRGLAERRPAGITARLLGFLARASQTEVRVALLRAFGTIGDREAVGPLSCWLLYPDPQLQQEARGALQQLLGPDYHEERQLAQGKLLQEKWEELVQIGSPALDVLAEVLRSREQSAYMSALRASAAVAIGRIGGEQARALLLPEINDGQPRVRAGVVTGLGELGDPSLTELLLPFLGDRVPQVREAAVRSLGKLHASSVAELIGRLYQDEDEGVRGATVEVLGTLDRPAIMPIVEILENGDSLAKRKAAQALAQIGDPGSIRYLEFALGDSDYHVRQAARDAMIQLGWLPLGQQTPAVADKPARWAYRAEWSADDDSASQGVALRRGLDSDDPLRRRIAAEALGMLGDRESIPGIRQLAATADADTRLIASQALVTLGEVPEVTPFWAPFWAFSGQWQHCVTLGEPAVEPLLAMLAAKVPRVRAEAAGALGAIGSPQAITGLTRLLTDPTSKVREVAAAALATIGGPAAADALLQAYRAEPDPSGRRDLLELALQLGPELLQPFLHSALGDEAPLVRMLAEELQATRQLLS